MLLFSDDFIIYNFYSLTALTLLVLYAQPICILFNFSLYSIAITIIDKDQIIIISILLLKKSLTKNDFKSFMNFSNLSDATVNKRTF